MWIRCVINTCYFRVQHRLESDVMLIMLPFHNPRFLSKRTLISWLYVRCIKRCHGISTAYMSYLRLNAVLF